MNKITVALIIALLLGLGGLVIWSSANNNEKVDYSIYDTTKIIAADKYNGNIGEHVRGKEDSKIVVVEYADLQCPGCATLMPKITKLHEQYGDRVAFVYRNYPIQGHQNARAAAAAAESAGFQGYYWQMVETIYANRADWISLLDTEKRTAVFEDLFKQVSDGKGDVAKFKSDLNNQDIQKKIDFDKGLGQNRDNVTATPSFYIDGENIELGSGGDVDKKIAEKIDEKLKAAGLETGPKEGTETKSE